MTGAVYLLKFSDPLGSAKHQARFYLGSVSRLDRLEVRLEEHSKGYGAAITRALVETGKTFELLGVIITDEPRQTERQIKNWKNHKRVASKIEDGKTVLGCRSFNNFQAAKEAAIA